MATPFSLDLAESCPLSQSLILRNFIKDSSLTLDYESTWRAMQAFTRQRNSLTSDEIWVLQHAPVYTLGQAGKTKHIIDSGEIPVVKVDRGGQVTYHGPGQLMFYFLLSLKRYSLSVREMVVLLENAVVEMLAELGIQAKGDRNAPGVYVDSRKIAALGLRISRGYSYHGLCLNVNFDRSPFEGINPCGYSGMEIAQISDYVTLPLTEALERMVSVVSRRLTMD